MSWDKKKRGGGRGYFYQSIRVDGRAVKKYLGTGPEAVEAACRRVQIDEGLPTGEEYGAFVGRLLRGVRVATTTPRGRWRLTWCLTRLTTE